MPKPKHFTSEFQRWARAHVKRESLQRAGRAGFKAAGGKLGWEKVNEKARQWRLDHPSGPEKQVMAILDAHGENYTREFPFGNRSIDFAWPEKMFGLEINGHQYKKSFGEDHSREETQAFKLRELTAAGWKIVVIHNDEISIETILNAITMPKALLPPQAGLSNSNFLQHGWLSDGTLCFFPSHAAISTIDIHDHIQHWRTRIIFDRYYKTASGGWSKLFKEHA